MKKDSNELRQGISFKETIKRREKKEYNLFCAMVHVIKSTTFLEEDLLDE